MAPLQLRGKPLIFMILITSGLDFLLFGYDQGKPILPRLNPSH